MLSLAITLLVVLASLTSTISLPAGTDDVITPWLSTPQRQSYRSFVGIESRPLELVRDGTMPEVLVDLVLSKGVGLNFSISSQASLPNDTWVKFPTIHPEDSSLLGEVWVQETDVKFKEVEFRVQDAPDKTRTMKIKEQVAKAYYCSSAVLNSQELKNAVLELENLKTSDEPGTEFVVLLKRQTLQAHPGIHGGSARWVFIPEQPLAYEAVKKYKASRILDFSSPKGFSEDASPIFPHPKSPPPNLALELLKV